MAQDARTYKDTAPLRQLPLPASGIFTIWFLGTTTPQKTAVAGAGQELETGMRLEMRLEMRREIRREMRREMRWFLRLPALGVGAKEAASVDSVAHGQVRVQGSENLHFTSQPTAADSTQHTAKRSSSSLLKSVCLCESVCVCVYNPVIQGRTFFHVSMFTCLQAGGHKPRMMTCANEASHPGGYQTGVPACWSLQTCQLHVTFGVCRHVSTCHRQVDMSKQV